MLDFVELWVYLTSGPLFGLTATVVVYVFAHAVYVKLDHAWANPVLWSVSSIACVLLVSKVQYPVYFAGAQFIDVVFRACCGCFGVAHVETQRCLTTCVAWFAFRSTLRRCGSGRQCVYIRQAFESVAISIAVDGAQIRYCTRSHGRCAANWGYFALAAVFTILNGMVGAVSGKYIFDMVGIQTDKARSIQRGFVLGNAVDGGGAARAMQVNADAGASEGFLLAIQVLLASILILSRRYCSIFVNC